MSFGLKNAGATYQRAIQLCFANQLHRNVEAYVDDVVVKTKTHDQFITDLEETFNSLRKFRRKLNPIKCVIGVPSGKLLGFIVSNRGIEANLEKINAMQRRAWCRPRRWRARHRRRAVASSAQTLAAASSGQRRAAALEAGGPATLARTPVAARSAWKRSAVSTEADERRMRMDGTLTARSTERTVYEEWDLARLLVLHLFG